MARAPKLHTRLTRNAAGLGSYSSLWLGADHLMIVTSTGYTESYARLQLRDVKGFFVEESDRRLGWGIAWGVLVGLFAIIAIVALVNGETPVWSGIFFALTTAALTWNHVLGPGCRAYVVTGVQTARLPSLVRMKKTRRVLARLRPLIEAAQADLVVAPVPVPVVVPMPVPPVAVAEPAANAPTEAPPVIELPVVAPPSS